MRIDIWSDVVCPWCYLGARRLRLALDKAGDDDVEVHWRAFQLDPSAPEEPRDLRETIDAKYSPGAFDKMTERLVPLGHEVGIDYRFEQALRVNTADAHRILAWAGTLEHGVQDAVANQLFHAYFTDGADVSSHEVLIDLAQRAGAPRDVAEHVLATSAFADVVAGDQDIARELSITGVPAMVIDRKWMVPGAQDVDHLVLLIERVRTKNGADG